MNRVEERPARGGRRLWAALGLGLVVGLANVAKPVHIDDTLYLEIARRIVAHPLDPYGGPINWQQVPEPTYKVSISPPLLSYWFALVLVVAGENVGALHASMIPWLLLASWGLYRLGERWAEAGLLTTVLVIGGPAVVVGTNLMLDVPLLACVVAAVEFLERRGSRWSLLGASACAAVGVLIKFPAVLLVPVFLMDGLRRRRWGPAFAAAGPIAALLGWQALSRSLYGVAQVSAGLTFLSAFRGAGLTETLGRVLSMLAILATTWPVWLMVGWRSRQALGPAVVAVLAVAAAAWLLHAVPPERPTVFAPVFLTAVFLGGFSVAAIVWPDRAWPVSEDDPRPLLAVWIAAGAGVVILFGPFVAVRSFLPIQPPLVLWLLGRRAPRVGTRGVRAAFVTLVLSGLLAATDMHWARCYPLAVRTIAERFGGSGRPIAFVGHWGWQYYAERAGWRAWDARRLNPPTGTLVVEPLRADKQMIHPSVRHRFRRVDRIVVPAAPLGLTTWNVGAGFRFYGGDFGQLPWGFSTEPTEQFDVYEVGPSASFPITIR